MPNKSLNFILPLVIYPFDIMFSFGESDKAIKKELKQRLPDNVYKSEINYALYGETARAIMVRFANGATLVRLKIIPLHPEDFGVLQHEIFHAVEFLFKRIGVKHNVKSSETWAYLIEWITQQVYKRIFEYSIDKNKKSKPQN